MSSTEALGSYIHKVSRYAGHAMEKTKKVNDRSVLKVDGELLNVKAKSCRFMLPTDMFLTAQQITKTE